MPELGPLGRGGARRRTRRRMAANEMQKPQEQEQEQQPETAAQPDSSDKLENLAKLLKDKGVITEVEYDLLFG